jgi:hypothetical protein
MNHLTRRQMLRAAASATAVPLLWSGLEVFGKEEPLHDLLPTKENPYADAVFANGPPPLPKEGNFTVVVLPDTQFYDRRNPDTYAAQTQWIVDHRDDRRIVSVLHLGDITDRNQKPQWEIAQAAMQRLDGHVPYFMCLGNHDYGTNGSSADRTTFFHDYFPAKKYQSLPNFGGSYDKEPARFDNSYHYFNAGGRDYLVLALEFGARSDVVRWANEVLDKHPNHPTILITHVYMYYDDTRYDYAKHGLDQQWSPHRYPVATSTNHDVNDGQQLWDNLLKNHSQVFMTLNGHVIGDGLGKLTSKNDAGKNVHQMLVNFQMRPNGGDGWLRLLEFSPDGKQVDVADYSPTRDEQNVAPENKFTLELS